MTGGIGSSGTIGNTMKRRKYCLNCIHLDGHHEYSQCNHPKNVIYKLRETWLNAYCDKTHTATPALLNGANDCNWYEEEVEKKSLFRRIITRIGNITIKKDMWDEM